MCVCAFFFHLSVAFWFIYSYSPTSFARSFPMDRYHFHDYSTFTHCLSVIWFFSNPRKTLAGACEWAIKYIFFRVYISCTIFQMIPFIWIVYIFFIQFFLSLSFVFIFHLRTIYFFLHFGLIILFINDSCWANWRVEFLLAGDMFWIVWLAMISSPLFEMNWMRTIRLMEIKRDVAIWHDRTKYCDCKQMEFLVFNLFINSQCSPYFVDEHWTVDQNIWESNRKIRME